MTEIQVPAARVGNPYVLTRDDRGLVRLRRQTVSGGSVTIVFGPADVINVANAMVDILEAQQ
ncbi:hypothetical protein L2K20_09955 [Mycobacterium sp. MBM]|nr:hypothetical protein [Mycobacterium sp. MBM]